MKSRCLKEPAKNLGWSKPSFLKELSIKTISELGIRLFRWRVDFSYAP